MTENEINRIIQNFYLSYGLTKKDLKNQVLNASTALKKSNFFNAPEFQKNWDYTRKALFKTEILTYSNARDIGLVMAIFSRETGPLNYRYYKCIKKNQLDKKYVTSGADVHKDGIAGFDFMLSGGQKRFHTNSFKKANITWEKVDAAEFRNGKTVQRPARIKVKDFLFSGFSMVAFSNKRLKEEIDDFESLSKESKRVWAALFFAGSGYAKHMKKVIGKHCDNKGIRKDYNLITDSSIKSSSNWKNTNARLINARRMGLKAEVYNQILEMEFLDIDMDALFNKVKDSLKNLW
ncbi:hypothetical protein ACOKFD_11025 [Flagellimonas sp. S174]|uniref:hypothetical protein n=1 Tax=Flagellimonas sp. S174 TaxID=3410790 RepID=UPI003BF4A00C